MKILTLSVILICSLFAQENNAPIVENVSFNQRDDGSFIVDIYYDVNDADNDNLTIYMEASNDSGSSWDFSAENISGDFGSNVNNGNKHIIWNFGEEYEQTLIENLQVRIIADDGARTGQILDADSNYYQTIKIGHQWWMKENLKTTHFQNGDELVRIIEGNDWLGLDSSAYCVLLNNESNIEVYGLLYNWYAVNDPRKIAPEGWKIPSNDEWKELEIYLGMRSSIADIIHSDRGAPVGGKLKEQGTAHWNDPNVGATNESGLTIIPGGKRTYNNFTQYTLEAAFWTRILYSSLYAFSRHLYSWDSQIGVWTHPKTSGFSVRCVKYDSISFGYSNIETISSITGAQLYFYPPIINLGMEESDQYYYNSFYIKNLGGDVLEGSVSDSVDWIDIISPDVFSLGYNDSIQIFFNGNFPNELGLFSSSIFIKVDSTIHLIDVFGSVVNQGGEINGQILFEGQAIPYHEIQLFRTSNRTIKIGTTYSDENGYFEFRGLEDGGRYWMVPESFSEMYFYHLENDWIYITGANTIKSNILCLYKINITSPGPVTNENPIQFNWDSRPFEKRYFISFRNIEYPFETRWNYPYTNSYQIELPPGYYIVNLGSYFNIDPLWSYQAGISGFRPLTVGIPIESVQGEITSNTIWEGEVHVTGDITVQNGATLTIEPGTVVYIDDYDALEQGGPDYLKYKIQFNIFGSLNAAGTEEEPIKFVPENEFSLAGAAFWYGIIFDEAEFSTISWCYFGSANVVFDVNNSSPIINNSIINKAYVGLSVENNNSAPQFRYNDIYGTFICVSIDNNVSENGIYTQNNFYTAPFFNGVSRAVSVFDRFSSNQLNFTDNYWGVPFSDVTTRISDNNNNLILTSTTNSDQPLGINDWSKELIDWEITSIQNSTSLNKISIADSVLGILLNNTLGPNDGSYISLGFNGYMIFDLGENNSIKNDLGDDVIIYESSILDTSNGSEGSESANIYLRNSLEDMWTLAGRINGSAGIDIDSLADDTYRYLKIEDSSIGDSLVIAPGFDLDAIKIQNNTNLINHLNKNNQQLLNTFSLDQNFPNPFNPVTQIQYYVPKNTRVKIIIYNILGEEQALLLDEYKPAGIHNIMWNASGFASGIYFYKLKAEGYTKTKKMLLLK